MFGPKSRRCSLCGISYPLYGHDDTCDVCETKTDIIHGPHDEDWREKVNQAKSNLAAAGPNMPGTSDKVIDWRLHQLLEAGYDVSSAAAIAVKREVDLHRAVRIVAQGCPVETAVAILL